MNSEFLFDKETYSKISRKLKIKFKEKDDIIVYDKNNNLTDLIYFNTPKIKRSILK